MELLNRNLENLLTVGRDFGQIADHWTRFRNNMLEDSTEETMQPLERMDGS